MLAEFKRSFENPKGFYDPITKQTTMDIYNNASAKGKRLLDDILNINMNHVDVMV